MNKRLQKRICSLYEILNKGIKILLGAWGLWIFIALIRDENYNNKMLISHLAALILALGLLVLGIIIWNRYKGEVIFNIIEKEKKIDKIVRRLTIIMFLLTFYIWINIYGKVGWDVWFIEYAARTLAGDYECVSGLVDYFNMYQNNIVLTWIYAFTLILNRNFGIVDVQNGQVVFIFFNTILAWLSVYCTYYCIKKNNRDMAFVGWAICAIMIGCSPWTTVPYSDALTVEIPIFIYTLYLKCNEKKWWLYIWIFFIAVIGYNIKPQTIIILIALLITELIHLKKEKYKIYIKRGIGAVIGIIFAMLICLQLTTMFLDKIPIEKEKGFSYTHWLMMGLNEGTNGKYSKEDVEFSASFADKSERTDANLAVIQERLKDLGFPGYFRLLTNKLTTIYDDATFSWFTGTGGFLAEIYPEKNSFFSKGIRELFYYEGKYYSKYTTVLQIVWFAVLILCFISVLGKKISANITLLMLSVLGATAFEQIFEVFTRHLYCNVPIYIVLAMEGWNVLNSKIMGLKALCLKLSNQLKTLNEDSI